MSVAPGATTSVKIGDESFDITIPSQGEGVRGIVIGDPCFTSEFITCVYKRPFDMFNRSTSIMNAIFQHDDVHFWVCLQLFWRISIIFIANYILSCAR